MNKDKNVQALKRFIKHDLIQLVANDTRLQLSRGNNGLTEYTFQAIIWDHICRFVGDSWLLSIEDFIPTLNRKADIVLTKLTQSGVVDSRCGSIAIEVKPNGQIKGLQKDLKKLGQYLGRKRSPVNFGVLIYLSSKEDHEDKLKNKAKKIYERRLAVVRVDPSGR